MNFDQVVNCKEGIPNRYNCKGGTPYGLHDRCLPNKSHLPKLLADSEVASLQAKKQWHLGVGGSSAGAGLEAWGAGQVWW